MKLSFVALALLAARATAIPVAGDNAADSQTTHGSLEVPDILGVLTTAPAEALPLLLQEIPINLKELPKEVLDKLKSLPLASLPQKLLGELTSLAHVKRDEESAAPATHGSLEVPDILGVLKTAPAEALPLLLQEIPINLKELPKEVLDKLKSLPLASLPQKLLSELTSLAHV